jgi:uncharacterized membrane protein
MTKGRLEAFSDGVIAIIITIMVLELKVPQGATFAAMAGSVAPVLLSYALSFVLVGIDWNNHHYLLHATRRVNGKVLWANLHLLFWLSLVPWATKWMADAVHEVERLKRAVACYGAVLLMAGLAYSIVQALIIGAEGPGSKLKEMIGRDLKGKLSAVFYVLAIGLAFVSPGVSLALFVIVAVMWLVPDPRIEAKLGERAQGPADHSDQ